MREHTSKARLGATITVALAAVTAFAVVGGTGLAGGLAKPVNAQYGPGQYQYGAKITICHKNKVTIRISINAWPAHQKQHGDQIGSCAAVAAAKAKAEKAELRAAKLKAEKVAKLKAEKVKAEKVAKLKAEKVKAQKLEAAKRKAERVAELKAAKLGAAKKAAKQAKKTEHGAKSEPVTTLPQAPVAATGPAKAKKPKKSSPAGGQAPVTQQQGVTASSRGNGNGKGPGGNGNGKGRG